MRLSDSTYEKIKKAAVQIYIDCDIHTIPLDPNMVCRKLNIELIKYSSKYCEDDLKIIVMAFPDGFKYKKNGKWHIEYNDAKPLGRIKSTIFHEIGHIVLKHQHMCTLAETEAQWFASYIMAPPPLVDMHGIDNFVELAETFELSDECAYNSMSRYLAWKRRKLFKYSDYEIELLKSFNRENAYNYFREVIENEL